MAPTEDLIRKIVILEDSITVISKTPVTTSVPDNDPDDGCNAIKYEYHSGGVTVILIKVINGGHTWPGAKQYLPAAVIGPTTRAFDASEVIAQFFLAHARN